MPLIDFSLLADGLPVPWSSQPMAMVGPARIKVLRMDPQPYEEEVHDYNEALLVVEGRLQLRVRQQHITVERGQMYLVEAGVPHAVAPGSHGTLVIVDV